MILKTILFTLSAGLLYTNTSLMFRVRHVEGGLFWLLVAFALTYSVISSLTLFELRSKFLTGCFAILDGMGIYMDFAGDCSHKAIGLYFGIYTALFSVAIFILKGKDTGERADSETIEGHNAEYWHRCFVYQKERADKAEGGQLAPLTDNATPQDTPAVAPVSEVRAIEPQTESAPPAQKTLPGFTNCLTPEQNTALVGIKRSFNRMKDEEKRREKARNIEDEAVREAVCALYGLKI